MAAAVAAPPASAPIGYPRNIRVTAALRCPSGACTAVSAEIAGMAPPRPKPDIARHNINCEAFAAPAHASVKTPEIVRAISSNFLRPQRSAANPVTVAPNAAPAYEMANSRPNPAAESAHSLEIRGAMNESIKVSYPSIIATAKQIQAPVRRAGALMIRPSRLHEQPDSQRR